MNKNSVVRCFVYLFGGLLLSACSLSGENHQTTNYYLFDANPSKLLAKPSATNIMLSEVKLPLYLNSSNLVMLDQNLNIVPANFHVWADSLDKAIQRALLNDLNASSAAFQFVKRCQQCTSIVLQIDHFYPTSDGQVLLSGHWYIAQSDETIPFFIEDKLEESGYSNAVLRMRAQIKVLSQQMIEGLTTD
jgi:uncharacterized lipoprotein YmbA